MQLGTQPCPTLKSRLTPDFAFLRVLLSDFFEKSFATKVVRVTPQAHRKSHRMLASKGLHPKSPAGGSALSRRPLSLRVFFGLHRSQRAGGIPSKQTRRRKWVTARKAGQRASASLACASAHRPQVGRGDDTVENPHRAQISQFELFELIL